MVFAGNQFKCCLCHLGIIPERIHWIEIPPLFEIVQITLKYHIETSTTRVLDIINQKAVQRYHNDAMMMKIPRHDPIKPQVWSAAELQFGSVG